MTERRPLKLSEVVGDTPAYLKRVGWTQGDYRRVTGEVCLSQAFYDVARAHGFNISGSKFAYRLEDAVSSAYTNVTRDVDHNIVGFNDDVAETIDDVIHICKLMAEDMEARGL